MRLGGLFSGVGGFELAWTQLGHEVAWMCEWDAKARKVLEARFPGVPIYPDVRDLDPAEVEAVDVLTGGSPCQGFSVAGTRTGLEHGESQLFADYVRILDGLEPRGLKWALWENVPGVLSIKNDDGERTFTHVIGALVGAGEPVRLDPNRKWNSGLAAHGRRAVAWRVLDSRYFGVAQRRRRVFACVAIGDSCEDRAVRTLLAVPEGLRRDSPPSRTEREVAAGSVAERVGVPSVARTLKARADSSYTSDGHGNDVVPDVAGTLGAKGSGGIDDLDRMTFIPDASPTVTSKWAKGSGGPAGSETGNMVVESTWWNGGDVADSLTTTSDAQRMPDKQRLQAVMDRPGVLPLSGPLTTGGLSSPRGSETSDSGWVLPDLPTYGMVGASGVEDAFVEEQPTITASHGQPGNVGLPIAFSHYASNVQASTEVTPTLLAGTNASGPAVAQPAMLLTMRAGKPGGGKGPLLSEEQSLTLRTGNEQTLFQPLSEEPDDE